MKSTLRRVEQLEELLNRDGGATCPHLPFAVREFNQNADGTRTEAPSPITGRYAPQPAVPNDAVCPCGLPRIEVHLVEVEDYYGPRQEAPQ